MRDELIQGPEVEPADPNVNDGRKLAPGRWASALSATVSVDLEPIFTPIGAPGRDMGWIAQAEAVQSVRPTPKRRWPWSALALGGTLMVLGAGGGLAGGYYLSAHSARPVRQQLYALQISDAPRAVPAPSAKPAPHPAPQPLPEARPLPTPPVASAPPPPVAQAPVAQAIAPPAPKVLTAEKAPDPVALRQAETGRQVKNLVADCDKGAGCDAASVTRADRLVGDAYASALQSGAPSRDLADVQRRWNDLRHETDEPPQILVGNYALLAEELSRMTVTAQRSRPSAKGAGR